MRKLWHYTNDIHDYVLIDNEKFKLNTAYDNIFMLIRALKDDDLQFKIDVFMRMIFFKSDHERLKKVCKEWELQDYISLINHITKNILFFEEKEIGKKDMDLDLDSELIFASFYYDYGISLIEKKGKMTWVEFIILLGNLSDTSPLGKMRQLVHTPSKELSQVGKREKIKRVSMLNRDVDIQSQINNLVAILDRGAKKVSKEDNSLK